MTAGDAHCTWKKVKLSALPRGGTWPISQLWHVQPLRSASPQTHPVWGWELPRALHVPAVGSRTQRVGQILGPGLSGMWDWSKVRHAFGFSLRTVLLSQLLSLYLCRSAQTQAIPGCLVLNSSSLLLLAQMQRDQQQGRGHQHLHRARCCKSRASCNPAPLVTRN